MYRKQNPYLNNGFPPQQEQEHVTCLQLQAVKQF